MAESVREIKRVEKEIIVNNPHTIAYMDECMKATDIGSKIFCLMYNISIIFNHQLGAHRKDRFADVEVHITKLWKELLAERRSSEMEKNQLIQLRHAILEQPVALMSDKGALRQYWDLADRLMPV